jgi:uncharacterized protein (TIGR00369 family)
MSDDKKAAFLAMVQKHLVDSVPLNRAIGMKLVTLEEDGCFFTIPYDERMVGNPETRIMHGGVITAFIDAACGAAVLAALKGLRRVATLDLRIDYMRPAAPERTVTCHARCYRVTRHVAFTRAEAYLDSPDELVATAAGTFAIFDQPANMTSEAKR